MQAIDLQVVILIHWNGWPVKITIYIVTRPYRSYPIVFIDIFHPAVFAKHILAHPDQPFWFKLITDSGSG